MNPELYGGKVRLLTGNSRLLNVPKIITDKVLTCCILTVNLEINHRKNAYEKSRIFCRSFSRVTLFR
jgi:hypothetical protein